MGPAVARLRRGATETARLCDDDLAPMRVAEAIPPLHVLDDGRAHRMRPEVRVRAEAWRAELDVPTGAAEAEGFGGGRGCGEGEAAGGNQAGSGGG